MKQINLQIINDKTKIMELLQNYEDSGDIEQLMYEKVEDFKYLGATQVRKMSKLRKYVFV